MGWMIEGSSAGRGWEFLFTTASSPALGQTQPPIRCVPGALFLGVKRQEREAITHLHLVPRPRMRGAIPPLPNTPSWRGADCCTGSVAFCVVHETLSIVKHGRRAFIVKIYSICGESPFRNVTWMWGSLTKRMSDIDWQKALLIPQV
jgi:hypothetical protein